MHNVELFALFTFLSICMDKFLPEGWAKKIFNTLLISGLFFIENLNIILALPLLMGIVLYWNKFNVSIEKLKQVALAIAAFTLFDDQFWKVLILMYLNLVAFRIGLEHKKVSAALTADKIYSMTFLLLGLFLVWFNRDVSGGLYQDYQLPIATGCLIIVLLRSFNILGSLKIMNIQGVGIPLGSKIMLQLVQNYYIPLQLVFIIKDQMALLGQSQMQWLAVFTPLILLISCLKHIYEIKVSHRKVPHDALLFNYYGALFFASAIFIEGRLFHQILVGVAYILVIYSALVVLSTKSVRPSLKTVLVILLLPTPLSFTFYQSLKIYNQLISSNFTLMSSTFILMIIGSFLLRTKLFGKYKLAYE